jgi:hypothetical protein
MELHKSLELKPFQIGHIAGTGAEMMPEGVNVGGQFKLGQVWALQNRPPQCGEI